MLSMRQCKAIASYLVRFICTFSKFINYHCYSCMNLWKLTYNEVEKLFRSVWNCSSIVTIQKQLVICCRQRRHNCTNVVSIILKNDCGNEPSNRFCIKDRTLLQSDEVVDLVLSMCLSFLNGMFFAFLVGTCTNVADWSN